MTESIPAPGLEFVFRIAIGVTAPIDLGEHGGHRRRQIPIAGGTVSGPRFNGVVLAGGADWQSIRSGDGVALIEARQTLRHDDGTTVDMLNIGIRRGPPDVLAKLAAGEVMDPALYYFRSTPRFSVAPGPHGWLADNAFVGTGRRVATGVEFDVFVVL